MKKWDEAGAGTIIKTVIAFPAKILSAQNRFQSLFRGGVVGRRSKCFIGYSATLGVGKAGSVGLRPIFWLPRCSSVSGMHTAFCAYQDSTRDSTAASAGV